MVTFEERDSHESLVQETDLSLPSPPVSPELILPLDHSEIPGPTAVKLTDRPITLKQKLEKSLFEQITNEEKRDIQLTECQVHPGDVLILVEWDQQTNATTGRQLTVVATAVHPVEEVPEGSIDEATEHGCITLQFKLIQPLSFK